jgi:hypothetical protein
MNEPKHYPVRSLDDIGDTLTPENAERFLIDVVLAFKSYMEVMHELKKAHPELNDKKNSDIMKFGFDWVDDGEHAKLSTHIEGPNGLEITIKHGKEV